DAPPISGQGTRAGPGPSHVQGIYAPAGPPWSNHPPETAWGVPHPAAVQRRQPGHRLQKEISSASLFTSRLMLLQPAIMVQPVQQNLRPLRNRTFTRTHPEAVHIRLIDMQF